MLDCSSILARTTLSNLPAIGSSPAQHSRAVPSLRAFSMHARHPSTGMPTRRRSLVQITRLEVDASSYNVRFPRVAKSCECHALTMDDFWPTPPVSALVPTAVQCFRSRRAPAKPTGYSRTWQESDPVYEIRLCDHPLTAPFNGRCFASLGHKLAFPATFDSTGTPSS